MFFRFFCCVLFSSSLLAHFPFSSFFFLCLMKPCALCQTTPSCQLIALKGVTLLVWKYYFMPVRLHYVWHFHGFSEKDWNKLCVSMTGCDKVPKDIIWVGFPWVIVMCRQNDGFIHPSIRILICLNKVVVSYKWSNLILFFLKSSISYWNEATQQ